MMLGKSGQTRINRSWIKLEDIKQKIPANSLIQSAQFHITFTTDRNVNIRFREIRLDLGTISTYHQMDTSKVYKELPANSRIFNIENLVPIIQDIVDGKRGNLLEIGLQNSDESNLNNYLFYQFSRVTLRVFFRGNVEITQLDKNDNPFGQVGEWKNNNWNYLNVRLLYFFQEVQILF